MYKIIIIIEFRTADLDDVLEYGIIIAFSEDFILNLLDYLSFYVE